MKIKIVTKIMRLVVLKIIFFVECPFFAGKDKKFRIKGKNRLANILVYPIKIVYI